MSPCGILLGMAVWLFLPVDLAEPQDFEVIISVASRGEAFALTVEVLDFDDQQKLAGLTVRIPLGRELEVQRTGKNGPRISLTAKHHGATLTYHITITHTDGTTHSRHSGAFPWPTDLDQDPKAEDPPAPRASGPRSLLSLA